MGALIRPFFLYKWEKCGFQKYWKSVLFIIILIQPYEILSTFKSTKIKDKYLNKVDCSFFFSIPQVGPY